MGANPTGSMGPSTTIGHTSTETGLRVSEIEMPMFGLGVYLMKEPGECKSAVIHAIESGYRLIDTAMAYGNEDEVGQAIKECGVDREELFIVTKLRRPHATGYDEVIRRCKQSLENLGLDHMDLYLVHAPPEDVEARPSVWRGMEKCLENGWTRAIGVSNYGQHHLDAMRSYASIMPSVNQIEIHPWLQRSELRAFSESLGATPMAYSPLARGHKVEDPKLGEVSARIGCTPAQAAIKWCIDVGAITIPKSSNHQRIIENFNCLDVDLSGFEDDFSAMDGDYVSGWDPTVEP
tara:strand:- start:22868 stop:23743 length:876 start_codon:yes stop_codon:yes gene_type:complete